MGSVLGGSWGLVTISDWPSLKIPLTRPRLVKVIQVLSMVRTEFVSGC